MLRLPGTLRLSQYSREELRNSSARRSHIQQQVHTPGGHCSLPCSPGPWPWIPQSGRQNFLTIVRTAPSLRDDLPQKWPPRERHGGPPELSPLSPDSGPQPPAPCRTATLLSVETQYRDPREKLSQTPQSDDGSPRFVNRGTHLPGQDKASIRDQDFHKLADPTASPGQDPESEGGRGEGFQSRPRPSRVCRPRSGWREGQAAPQRLGFGRL